MFGWPVFLWRTYNGCVHYYVTQVGDFIFGVCFPTLLFVSVCLFFLIEEAAGYSLIVGGVYMEKTRLMATWLDVSCQ